jgi:hypothetical protein
MRRISVVLVISLASAAIPAFAQSRLPDRFAGWTGETVVGVFAAEVPKPLAVANSDVLREYGAESLQRRNYSHGSASLAVTLYRMHDPTSAYGAFTFLQDDTLSPSDLAPYSSLSRQRALLLVGNLLIEVTGADLRPAREDLKALVAELAPHADRSPYPTLGNFFPGAGLVRNSQRYLLGPLALNHVLPFATGDWVGFENGAEAELARYRLAGQEATLLLISYPTPQVAARQVAALPRWFTINPAEDPGVGPPTAYVRRASSLVAIVTQTRSSNLALSLLEKIHYQSEITWNEPHQSLTDPTWGQFVVGAFVGTGIIMVFALVAGIGFGGIRLLTKYFFPGRVFDRAERVEILQLGLSSKPIEAKDFY